MPRRRPCRRGQDTSKRSRSTSRRYRAALCRPFLRRLRPSAKPSPASARKCSTRSGRRYSRTTGEQRSPFRGAWDAYDKLTGATKESDEARDTLEAVARLIGEVPVPSPADAERTVKVAGAGIGAGAAIGFAVGGPLGWLLGGAVGLLVSAVVDHATDTVTTREELRGRTTRLATQTFSSFRTALDAAIASAGEEVDRRVRTRMQPFLDEMEQRLDAIREPTPDELRLHEELGHTTAAALKLLRQVLQIDGSGPARELESE